MAVSEGFLSFILTAHVPYLRTPGRHPHGEEDLHETIAFSLVPVLNVLADLREAGMAAPVGLAVSPVLLEQLADNIVQKHFITWMEEWLGERADALSRWERQGATHPSYLGRFYIDWGRGVLRSFSERFGRNLVGAMRELGAGLAEPLAGAATHAYLPLLGAAGSRHAQIHAGLLTVSRHFGRRPEGLWLPECGFHPALLPAVRSSELRYMVADPSSVADTPELRAEPAWAAPGRLQVLQRSEPAAALVWSPELGFPGDAAYRAPGRDPRSGLELWRNGAPGGPPELYDPYDAFRRAEEHAAHFLAAVTSDLAAAGGDRPGLAVVPIDMELLGRRWFEGPVWLRAVLERSLRGEGPALAAPSEYLRAYRTRRTVALREGSWGAGGGHQAWSSPGAQPIWRAVAEAEERMAELVRATPGAEGEQERALNQAMRELLLAQASDWPLMAGAGGANEAMRRVATHLERFEQLCRLAEGPAADHADAIGEIEDLDSVFPHINYRVFAEE